jgi:dUTP pyrophosphatase
MPTGIAIALPPGFAAFIHPRSGLAIRDGLSMVNAPGTIDASYRGEIQVILVNMDIKNSISIARGDRIAQLVIQRVENVNIVPVSQLPGTERGAGGFGSTGKK